MSHKAELPLLDYLTQCYASLKSRLTHVLGCADLASDALHDTWVRLKDKGEQRVMDSPAAYLMRVAVNIAVDIQRRQRRILDGDEVEELLEALADPKPGPAQLAESRSELAQLTRAMEALPERRRLILVLVHWDGVPQKEVASRLGVSLRTVEYELKRAHDALDAHFLTLGEP